MEEGGLRFVVSPAVEDKEAAAAAERGYNLGLLKRFLDPVGD